MLARMKYISLLRRHDLGLAPGGPDLLAVGTFDIGADAHVVGLLCLEVLDGCGSGLDVCNELGLVILCKGLAG